MASVVTSPVAHRVRACSGLNELPTAYARLLARAGSADFFLTPDWFHNFATTALDSKSRPLIYCVGSAADPEVALALLMACTAPPEHSGGLRKLTALTSFYSCFFAPHVAADAPDAGEVLAALCRELADEKPRWDVVDLHPLDVGSDTFSYLVDGLKSAGFVVQTYFGFGNWYCPVNGRCFDDYVASLPSVLKNTLNRKRKKLERTGRARIEIVMGGPHLEAAIQAYTKVYLASWKRPEPYPDFIPGLIRTCAGLGTLRLGLVHVDGEPAAAQLWIVHNGVALIYKLAYDERFADLSVGSILTATLMQHVLDTDKVEAVDYLSGDDAYKKDWMSLRRERWGILAMNPKTPRGLWAISKNIGGRKIKRAAAEVRRRLELGRHVEELEKDT